MVIESERDEQCSKKCEQCSETCEQCSETFEESTEKCELSSGSLFGKQKKDLVYRHRFLHTVCIGFCLFVLGCRNAMIGPTFPDLRLIADESLSTASWIFTAKSLGGLVGASCAGVAYDRFKLAVFIVTVCGIGVMTTLVPWCYHFAAMVMVHGIQGVFGTAMNTAATADVAAIWKDQSGPFMQAVHSAFSVGGIIAPLMCEPFLAQLISRPKHLGDNTSVNHISSYGFTTISYIASESNKTSQTAVNNSNMYTVYDETHIFIPYTMVTCLCLLAMCCFIVVRLIYGNVYTVTAGEITMDKKEVTVRHYFLDRKMKNIFTFTLALSLFFYGISEHCFMGFLMTFVISELEWSKAKGSTATFVLWLAFAAGRIAGIFVVKLANLTVTTVLFMSLVTTGALLMLLSVLFTQNFLFWVSVLCIGFGMSVIMGSVFSWLSQNVQTLTGKITSFIFVLMNIGNVVAPLLVGNLMEKVSNMWFIYAGLLFFSLMFICFLFTLITFTLKKRFDTSAAESDGLKNNLE